MEKLPDELIFQVIRFLGANEVIQLQSVSQRFLKLARDTILWKTLCYESSNTESVRQRKRQEAFDTVDIAEFRAALATAAFTNVVEEPVQASNGRQAAGRKHEQMERLRSLANWEPGYPGEVINYYEEYIQRHAYISVEWINRLGQSLDEHTYRQATGVALLRSSGQDNGHIVSALDDGSITIYDIASPNSQDGVVGKTASKFLTPSISSSTASTSMMTETGSIEVVSINKRTSCGYFAVGSTLHEVDLRQLSIISSQPYPFPITALSRYDTSNPLVVGTNATVHLYDPRDRIQYAASDDTRTELIAGSPTSRHIVLSQPGPLSILHAPDATDSIWITGRFTSMLQHSLRYFPRLLSTIHSGARISCMTALQYPYIDRDVDLIKAPHISLSQFSAMRSESGWTAICAGEYKGKGSLELFAMGGQQKGCYLNRQTASASKLLSVACHGGKLVYSDGDGNLRWKERNGTAAVRSYNINIDTPSEDVATRGVFGERSAQDGDIVQKILPFTQQSTSGLTSENLLLWTGDGKIGTLSFGPRSTTAEEDYHDAVEVQAESTAERAKQDAERQYAMAMRRALQRNADEVRFVRGLGMR